MTAEACKGLLQLGLLEGGPISVGRSKGLGDLPGFACARGEAFKAGAARCARTARNTRPPFPVRGAFLGEGLLRPRPGDPAAAAAAPPSAPTPAAHLTAMAPFRGSYITP